jgi:hypothetical protein
MSTNVQYNGDTITEPKQNSLHGYYRQFGGLWVDNEHGNRTAVTIDTVVIAHGETWIEINGTAVEAIQQGKLP